MAKLVVFYSRADENYFSGSYRYISVGNTEKVANMIAEMAGADLFKIQQKVPYSAAYDTCKGATVTSGLAIQGGMVDHARLVWRLHAGWATV